MTQQGIHNPHRESQIAIMDTFMTQGESLPAFRFADIGDTISGTIQNVTQLDDRAPDGTPKTWANGDPVHVWVFDLDTTGTGTADTCIWVRGNMVKAIRDALATAKLQPSDHPKLTVRYDGNGEPKNKGFHPAKLYKAKAEPAPRAAAQMDDF